MNANRKMLSLDTLRFNDMIEINPVPYYAIYMPKIYR